MTTEPVALVGAGVRLPGGIATVGGWWDALRDGRDLVGPVPPDRWDPVVWGTPAEGAFLTDPLRFDAAFFGMSPREAADADPAQRLLLETAWEALEQAGHRPDTLGGSATGVWVGLGSSDWSRRHFGGADPARVGPHAGTGSFLSVAAGRVAYTLGLRGPALTVDTACSSSLVAVHLAVRALRAGEVDLALVGGASLLFSPIPSVYFQRLGALSADGRCRTFDASASGYGRGEAVVTLALARLSDAVRDGAPILAVIRGSAVNHDGRTNGLTAPSGAAQQAVVRGALADAGAEPGDVVYVEAHGTGTPLGDPVEVEALRAVFLPRSSPLHLGSAKTNVGHTETAAGVVGLLKAALVLRHGEVVPHLHLRTPNPRLDLGGIVVDAVAGPLPAGLAGVSSFGLSGTNAHVVLGPPPKAPPPRDGPVVVPLSARTLRALRATADRWADTLPHGLVGIEAAAAARARHPVRAAVVASTREELAAGLRAVQGATAPRRAPSVAFVCAGQGSQLAGMGLELRARDPVFRAAFDEVAAAVDAASGGPPLVDVVGDADLLRDTRWTQPALVALQVGLAAWWQGRGVAPDVIVGHSVGELSAAVIAGVFTRADGARLAVARGRLLGALPTDGAMWAVLAPEDEVRRRVGGTVDIAAVNRVDETVVSGRRDDLEALRGALSGLEVRPLHVSHPFHSRWVEPAMAPFEDVVRAVPAREPDICVISATDGRPLGPRATDPAFWRDHVRAPVRFLDALRGAADEGATVFVELSARAVASGLVEAALGDAAVRIPTLRAGQSELASALGAVGAAFVAGVDVRWPEGPLAHWLPPGAFDGDVHAVDDPTPAPPGPTVWREVAGDVAGTPAGPVWSPGVTDPASAASAFAEAARAPRWSGRVAVRDDAAGRAVYGAFLALAAEAPERATAFSWDGPADAIPDGVTRDGRRVAWGRVPVGGAQPLSLGGGSVIVTGATGGLGPAVLGWLAARGAGEIVVVSRSGKVPPGAPSGVRGVAIDLAAEGAAEAVSALAASPSLVGVVCAAGLADDAAFDATTPDQFRAAVRVKVDSAQALDAATRGRGLPLFLAVSSASAWVGNPGQAAYAAANGALEALVAARIAAGEAGAAVALGPVDGPGLADRPPAQIARWERDGMPRTAVGAAVASLDRGAAEGGVVLAAPFDWARVHAARPAAPCPVGFAAPAPAAAPERPSTLAERVAGAVRGVLGASPASSLDPDAGLFDLGLDSVTTVELRKRLETIVQRPLSATVAIDHPTVNRLVAHLTAAEHVAPAPEAAPPSGPIAIVGWSCVLPGGIDHPSGLWDLLVSGATVLGAPPPGRDPALGPGGYVDTLFRFDAAAFGIGDAEARAMDPRQRLLLTTTREALEDAGIRAGDDGSTGVFVGLEPGDYVRRLRADDVYAATGNQPSVASGRLSYVFGWQGPSITVDAACASGLAALVAAVRELRAGGCRRAVVGSANATTQVDTVRALAALGATSPTGAARVFDAAADGYVRSEGAVVLVLEPLSVARAAGRPVHAVIEGVASGHDGAAAGLTVPNGPAQAAVIRRALDDAGIGPDDVGAVEAHGTGTPLGDPVEWGAWVDVFGARTAPLWIGAPKAAVGHLEAASGLVGVLAGALRLQSTVAPPIAGLVRRNPALADAPALRLPTAAEPATVSRVGVSAFGIAGADVHVVLGPGDGALPPGAPGLRHLFVSARDDAALRATAARWARRLHGDAAALEAGSWARAAGPARAVARGDDVGSLRVALAAITSAAAPAPVHLVVGPGDLRAVAPAVWDAARSAVDAVRERGSDAGDAVIAGWVLRDQLARHEVTVDSVSAARPEDWVGAMVVAGVVTLPAAAKLAAALRRASSSPVEVRRAAVRAAFAAVMLRRPTVSLADLRLAGDAARTADAWVEVTEDSAVSAVTAPDAAALRAWLADAWAAGKATPVPDRPGSPPPPTALVGVHLEVPARPLPRWRVDWVDHAPRSRSAAAEVDTSALEPGSGVARAKALVLRAARRLAASPRVPAVFVTLDGDAAGAALGGFVASAIVEGFPVAHVAFEGPPEPATCDALAHLDLAGGVYRSVDGALRVARLVADPGEAAPPWDGPVLVAGGTGAVGGAVVAAISGAFVLARALPVGARGLAWDLTTPTGLRAAWDAQGHPAPATVVHAVGVRADVSVASLDEAGVDVAFGALVSASESLRAAFPQARHVGVGSAAAVIGNAGQSAYAAAHAFVAASQDSIALGPVAGGIASGVDWGRLGVRPFDRADVPAALLAGGVALDVDWPAWGRAVPRVPRLVEALVGARAAPPSHVGDTIAAAVRDVLGRDVDPDRGFFESGLDSIGVVAVAQRLTASLGRDVAPARLFDHPTPARLAAALSTPTAPVVAARMLERDGVVIVAAAVRLPGASDGASFAAALAAGTDVVRPTPRWRWDESRHPELAGREASWLADDVVRGFDADAFGMSPGEAAAMDPQQRLLLTLAIEAFERAGIRRADRDALRIGVIVGAGDSGYLDRSRRTPRYPDGHAGIGNLSAFASGRVAHELGLRGPSFTLNTACSSTHLAVHLARRAILDDEADVVLAGGVHLMLSPDHAQVLARMGATSPTGRCRTFDAAADGYARGEGAGWFVLAREGLSRARGWPVAARILGSATTHDGRASGPTAPSGASQEAVIRAAWRDAGVDVADAVAIEAHGTGTPLGDPIEVDALHRVFGDRPAAAPLLLGSVKTNVGHLELAAGVASIAKVLGAFARAELPPHLHLRTPAPSLALSARGYVVPAAPTPLPPGPVGVSGFGLSGTNVHLVLGPERNSRLTPETPGIAEGSHREPPAPAEDGRQKAIFGARARLGQVPERNSRLTPETPGIAEGSHREPPAPILASGPSEAALLATIAAMPRGRVAAHALIAHRDPGPWRAAAVGDGPFGAPHRVGRGPVVWLFPGQGSQAPGMGLGLAALYPVVRATFDEARDVLGGGLFDAWADDRVHDTEVTQPALVVLEVALARMWASFGVVPDEVLGHSVGQFAAAVVAGAAPFADVVRLVGVRAHLLAGVGEGAMLAVDAGEAALAPLLGPRLALAAVNGPRRCTLAGDRAAVDAAAESLRARGIRATSLRVQRAFHSPLVDPVVGAWAAAVAQVRWGSPTLCWRSGLDGAPITDPAATLTAELRATVRFADGLAAIAAGAPRCVIEVGPHPVLSALAAEAAPRARVAATLRHGEDPAHAVAAAVGEVFVAGVELRASGLFPGEVAPPPSLAPVTRLGHAPHWLAEDAPDDEALAEVERRVEVAPGAPAATITGAGPLADALRAVVLPGGPSVAVLGDGEGAEAALAAVRAGAAVVVTSGGPGRFGAHGLLRSLRAEDPRRAPRLVDVDGAPAALVAAAIAAGVDEVTATAAGVARRVLVPAALPQTARGAWPVTVITGGFSGIGLLVARALRGRVPGLVLASRREPDDEVSAFVRAPGAPVRVVRGDIADPEVADEVVGVAESLSDGAPIGVVHAAGALADKPFDAVTAQDLERAARGKVGGFRALDARLGEVAFFVVLGAGAAVIGTPGQAAYCAANAELTGWCRARAARGAPVSLVHLGAWDGVGMAGALDAEQRRRRAERGLRALSPERGVDIVLRAASEPGEWAVVPTDWRRYVDVVHAGSPPPLLAELVPPGVPANRRERLVDKVARSADRASAARDAVGVLVARVLRRPDPPGREVPLFSVGFDSLLAIELRNALVDEGFDVPVAQILAEPTITTLADAARAGIAPPTSSPPSIHPLVSHAVALALGVFLVVVAYVGTAWWLAPADP